MASDLIVAPISIPASGDLSANQFLFHRVNSSGQLALPDLAGGRVVGVLQDKPTAAGQPGQICGPGSITKVKAGAGITKGYYLTTNTSGQAVQAVSGNYIHGVALDTVNSGEFVRMRYSPTGRL